MIKVFKMLIKRNKMLLIMYLIFLLVSIKNCPLSVYGPFILYNATLVSFFDVFPFVALPGVELGVFRLR